MHPATTAGLRDNQLGVANKGVSSTLALVVMAAFALRAAVGIVRHHGTSWWESGYSHYAALARNIVTGDGFHLDALNAPRPPLYPLLLAAEYLVAGTGNVLPVLVQSAIGAGSVLMT